MQHDAGSPTGRSAMPGRPARPHSGDGTGPRNVLGLPTAVELRLGEKRTGQLQNVIGPPQLLDFALQLFDALDFSGGHPRTLACIHLCPLHPGQQGRRYTANLGGDRFDGCPQGWIFTAMLLHQSDSALTDLRGKLVRLVQIPSWGFLRKSQVLVEWLTGLEYSESNMKQLAHGGDDYLQGALAPCQELVTEGGNDRIVAFGHYGGQVQGLA